MKGHSEPIAIVESHVGRAGIPTARSFDAWVRAALSRRRRRCQVGIQLFGPAQARAINRKFRGKDYATNVLSFPYEPLPTERTGLLGDLVLCSSVVAREARQQGKPVRHHYAHLTIHGVLHLLGYDHGTKKEANRMEALEVRILARLGIPAPYS
jgi:probable rRNA maturation factor